MTYQLVLILIACVLGTSFISGLFGMAGGFILMGLLLHFFPPATAMALHGVAQMASNFWRTVLWRNYIYTKVLSGYLLGVVLCVIAFTALQIQLELKYVYLFLGLLPFISFFLKNHYRLDITKPGMSIVCGFSVVITQLTAGVSAGFLDQFFIHSGLDRRTQMATKAATQVMGHFAKIIYFTVLLQQGVDWKDLSWPILLSTIITAMLGNTLAVKPLQKMKQEHFVSISVYLLMMVGAWFLYKAAVLFYYS